MASFNFIAPAYGWLSRLVFGHILLEAQQQFLGSIAPGSKIVFLGGGAGQVLNELFAQEKNISIDFVEPSERMLRRARKTLLPSYRNRVNFIQGTHQDLPAGKVYDAAAVFFVYDILAEGELLPFSETLHNSLKPGGILLFADFFKTSRKAQRLLLWAMYSFFKIFAGISAKRLPDYDGLLGRYGFSLMGERLFSGGFVRARLYARTVVEEIKQ